MALIIDVETTGLPARGNTPFGKNPYYKNLDAYENCRIVQLSYMICDENLNEMEMKDFIIKSNGFSINNSQFHGITDEISQSKGVSISDIKEEFSKCLKESSFIIAHNADFDVSVIKNELYRLDMNDIIEEIEKKNVLCTMQRTKDMVQAKDKIGRLKVPRLDELYKFVMNTEMENAHNSNYDVINLHKAVKTLYDTGRFRLTLTDNISIKNIKKRDIVIKTEKVIKDKHITCTNTLKLSDEEQENLKDNILESNMINREVLNLSDEQNNVIKCVESENNVCVDSVAGSGKTTTILHIAEKLSNLKILLITYNAKLKLETREKSKKLGLNNIEVHSYHSFGVKYYDNKCYTDDVIEKIVKNNYVKLKQINFDILVLDEVQDISSLYYNFVCKIYSENIKEDSRICIFGDKRQCIFKFNNADERFLEYHKELFDFNTSNWVKCNLSTSFRITREMSLFINKCLLKTDFIFSNKVSNIKPRYLICDSYYYPIDEFRYYINIGYKPEDIFILAPSVRSKGSYPTPVKHLENTIKRLFENINIFIPTSDEEKLDEDLIKGKLVFSTFHQSKGLERKVVLVFNFDSSYFNYYKKDYNRLLCPNEIYVATTRAIEHLSVFHSHKMDYLEFINVIELNKYCDLIVRADLQITSKEEIQSFDTSVTEITNHLNYIVVDKSYNYLEISKNHDYSIMKVNIPLKITKDLNQNTVESVSEITGIAIPSLLELELKGNLSIFDYISDPSEEIKKGIKGKLTPEVSKKCIELINKIDINNIKSHEILELCNIWNMLKNGYVFKLYQIQNYNWLSDINREICMNNCKKLCISKNCIFEHLVSISNTKEEFNELLNRRLVGFIDCVDEENKTVYEFKCVQEVKKEHFIQLAFYMYIYENRRLQKYNELVNKHKENILKLEKKRLSESYTFDNQIFYKGEKVLYIYSNKKCEGEICIIYKTNNYVQILTENNNKIKVIRSKISKLDTNSHKSIDVKKDSINKITKEIDEYRPYKYVLYNIITNEYFELKCDMNRLKEMVRYIIYTKYTSSITIDDVKFLEDNKKIRRMYFED